MREIATAAVMAAGLTGGTAWGASFTLTSTADWATGLLTNTNTSPPPATGNGHVRLNDTVLTPFSHIWVALSGRDGAVRIDTNVNPATIGNFDNVLTPAEAGGTAVLGEYLTRPNGRAGNPSRTTVDANGDVWVGNRNESNGGSGSVTKISASPAAGAGTSNGVWDGSTFNRLAWTNAGGADNNGGVSTAADSAITQYVRTLGANVRHVSVDKNNNVWVGGGPLDAGDQVFQLHNGSTGAVIPTAFGAFVPDNNTGGYGGLVDGNGVVWSAGLNGNSLTRFDPATGARTTVNQGGRQSYGMGIDSKGNIWVATWTNNTLDKIDPNGNVIASYNIGAAGSSLRGVAVTAGDDIWVASSGTHEVIRFNSVTNTVTAQIAVGNTPTGVAVDSNGKVWVTNYGSDSVMRIDPASNAVDLTVQLGGNANPYNYSDMTGTVLVGSTNPTGTWRRVMDGGLGADWGDIFFNQEIEGSVPATTGLLMEARVSDDLVTWSTFSAFDSGDDVGLAGRYLEVRATLSRLGGSALTPVLSDLTVNFTAGDNVPGVPEPGSLLLAGLALAGLASLRLRRR